MDDIDQFFKNSHYNIIRVLLTISGLWPFHTLRRRCTIYIVMILVFGSGFMFEILGIINIRHDTFELLDSVPIFLFAVVTVFKIICGIYKIQKIKLLLIHMREYCLSPKSEKETKIHNSHALYGRNFGYIYAGIVISHPFVFQTMVLVGNLNSKKFEENVTSLHKAHKAQYEVSYPVNYMVDLDTYYVPIFMHTAVCEMGYTFIIVTFDVLYIILVEHCCGLLESLRYRLENALNSEDNDGLMSTQDKSYLNIAYSVQRHIETMQFISIMESLYSLPLFIHMGCLLIILSVIEFQVAINTGNLDRLIKHFSFMNVVLINVFFENWLGQKITDSSEKVFESAYNTEWYNMSITTRKLLIMILMASKEPVTFTVGNLFALSYVTFNTVLRTSMSYFMLLRSVQSVQ